MAHTTTAHPPNSPGATAARLSNGLNYWVERVCAVIIAVLIVDIWIGVFGRYVFELPVTWSEELARYLMIWAALLAVSSGVARREHVAVTALFDRFPAPTRRLLRVAIDLLAFVFFAYLLYFGIGMTRNGATQYATIFEMTMTLPFAAVPVSSALICVQLALAALRDFGGDETSAHSGGRK